MALEYASGTNTHSIVGFFVLLYSEKGMLRIYFGCQKNKIQTNSKQKMLKYVLKMQ